MTIFSDRLTWKTLFADNLRLRGAYLQLWPSENIAAFLARTNSGSKSNRNLFQTY